jgi:hypothetical protein
VPIPISAPLSVAGVPAEISSQVEKAIKPLITEQSAIVRVEDKDGITLRCSTKAGDGTIRLIEMRLVQAKDGKATAITISSVKFAFFGKSKREQADYDTEQTLAQAIGQNILKAVTLPH